MSTISVIHGNKIYEIYYGISGSDYRLFTTSSEKQKDSRISTSSKGRFLSNDDFYLTWYYYGELTKVECLYIESNMSLYQHQDNLPSTCKNKVQTVLFFDEIDSSLVEICIFLISKKLNDADEVYGLRMNPKMERYAITLDKFISELKKNYKEAKVVTLSPKLDIYQMVQNLATFSKDEIGSKFEFLDSVFVREKLNGLQIIVTSEQFIGIIMHFNLSKMYIDRCAKPYEALFNKKDCGLSEKIETKNAKTPLWVDIVNFFRGKTSTKLLTEFPELSFGCLLYLLYAKANLFCYNNKVYTVGGELIANVNFGRLQNETLKAGQCTDIKCDLAFQVTFLNQFVITATDEQLAIEFAYIVQPKAIRMKSAEYCIQKLHRGNNCSALNLIDLDFRNYLRNTQAESLVAWIEKFNRYQLKIEQPSSSPKLNICANELKTWLKNTELKIDSRPQKGNNRFIF